LWRFAIGKRPPDRTGALPTAPRSF